MALVPRLFIDPYGQQLYKDPSSKSIFKDQTYYSNVIKSLDVNKLTNVFDKDVILNGLNLKNLFYTNEDRTINFVLTPGRIIQDNNIVDILEDVHFSIDIFSKYDLVDANYDENYFEIDGDHVENFPYNKTFAIFDSNYATQFNHNHWVVKEARFDDGKTRIYTIQNINSDDITGHIVNDNFPNINDNPEFTILIMSKFQYLETIKDNYIEFVPVYTTTDSDYFTVVGQCYPEYDEHTFRIIYGAIYFKKDLNDFKLLPVQYVVAKESVNINIYGKDYTIRNLTKAYKSYLDGGEIN